MEVKPSPEGLSMTTDRGRRQPGEGARFEREVLPAPLPREEVGAEVLDDG